MQLAALLLCLTEFIEATCQLFCELVQCCQLALGWVDCKGLPKTCWPCQAAPLQLSYHGGYEDAQMAGYATGWCLLCYQGQSQQID